MYNATSGETVTYQYDSLNRLTSAAGTGAASGNWSDTYGFDSFGNLLSKTPTVGTLPSMSQGVNPATNQTTTYGYDANGNQTGAPGSINALTYDAENRLLTSAGVQYNYDSQNKRVWTGTVDGANNLTGQAVSLFGVDGQKLGTYSFTLQTSSHGLPQYFADPPLNTRVYFAGKHIADIGSSGTVTFRQDRLGSNAADSLYPWSEDRGTPGPNDQVKFATYTRDSATLLDYADQRYYVNNQGRFLTPDPYQASIGPSDPGSWNRYAYTRGDPVNRVDLNGLQDEGPPDPCANPFAQGCLYQHLLNTNVLIPGPDKSSMEPGMEDLGYNRYQQQMQKQAVKDAASGAEKLLSNPKCALLFGGASGKDPGAALQSALDNGHILTQTLGPDISWNIGGYTQGGNIYIATNHFFFTGLVYGQTGTTDGGHTAVNGFYNVTSPPPGFTNGFAGLTFGQMQELVLMHELLHLLGIAGADNANQQITLPDGETVTGSAGVTAAIRKDCF
jgi:RHS repeat-associated protein